ncbi:hypothetical protein C8A05DRAFT_15745 [Staphylotrichum tortipilum]|uniref:FAD-binding PCMH-type domain-containing protein n=1 Tax=Staphylotrichum tortipilum TaxID=2831512 RepID=A0AAN6RTQ0_9PEZI|nr:hypothetical protein C8A05DRAFT_15745 [Staphylotrichum longicolle]
MATLDSLQQALVQKTTASPVNQRLTDGQYDKGFDILANGPGWMTYQDFIIPQLTQLLTPLFASRLHLSILEVGPGPKSVLGYLPAQQRNQIYRYVAFEPNDVFASSLEGWLRDSSNGTVIPLPCLERPPKIHRRPFGPETNLDGAKDGAGERFDVVLFCHSMYGMQPKEKFIHRALELLVGLPREGLVVVFHRDSLRLDGLVCHRTASFPTGLVRVASDSDDTLDRFAAFIAGFDPRDDTLKAVWRGVCRRLGGGHGEPHNQPLLTFSAPEVMMAFTQHATTLPELLAEVPAAEAGRIVKNREARRHRPAAIVRPHEIRHIQSCVRWALRNKTKLTTIGGGHSGHCVWPGVVAVDLGAFDRVHVVTPAGELESEPLVVAEAGSTTGEIIRKAMAAGLSVPLGARPSVGAGLWLQGGIGHLARVHGLACDAIVGAVVVSVESGAVLCVGRVPSEHRPHGSVSVEELDLLWALKGAGTNFGIVVSVAFKACAAPTYSVRNWIVPLIDSREALRKLSEFDELVTRGLSRNCAADAYLYWDNGQLHLGVTTFDTSTEAGGIETHRGFRELLGPQASFDTMDSVRAFGAEMYMSGMHGGHSGGKTSSFKRCMFLKGVGQVNVGERLVAAVQTRPTPRCYLHLLHGRGAVRDVPADSTAFGCRDWDFACVITGVWPRDQDGTAVEAATVRWVYHVAEQLLPLSCGAYGADLGPDPRDAVLAARAFGRNLPRLARLKRDMDPQDVLAFACPLPAEPMEPKLIILVTGDNGAGKDYCADIWVSVFADQNIRASAVSISEATKREYAAASGTDLDRLLQDRDYKEQHRPELTAFFQAQVRRDPKLPERHFLDTVGLQAAGMDVLLITGMRDEAPVATFSALAPSSKLVQVRITRTPFGSSHPPALTFLNITPGDSEAQTFATTYLLPRFSPSLDRLAALARPIPSFPQPGIQFRHVLNIAQHRDGLAMCASLLQDHLPGDWAQAAAIVCVEVGGFVFAAALATKTGLPLALVRGKGRLPPPTVRVGREASHISAISVVVTKDIEMEAGVVPKEGWVVVVDDVLATGETLCAVLRLLHEVGVKRDRVVVLVVAEFPVHRGREKLRREGFGGVEVHTLLVFDGM